MEQRAASDMLEDALQQFDNIIEGSGQNNVADLYKNGGLVDEGFQGIGQLMDDLKMTIEAEQISGDDGDKLLSLLSPKTLQFYLRLFKSGSTDTDSKSDAVQRLQSENESLTLQVSVLTDQVELQMEKVEELVNTIKDLQNKLLSTEESLQKEILARTEHESRALALMEQLSDMKIRLVQYEQMEKKEAESLPKASIKENISDSPHNQEKAMADVMSPDEGIVHDEDSDVQGRELMKLRMPEPQAMSTPIAPAVGSTESSKDSTYETRTRPEIGNNWLQDDVDGQMNLPSTPRASGWNDGLRSISLERLHGHRVSALSDRQTVENTSSQNEKLESCGEVDFSPKPTAAQANSKSSSSPNLAMTEMQNDCHGIHKQQSDGNNYDVANSNFQVRKKHGFRKFFSSFKLRRSSSSGLQNSDLPVSPAPRERPAKPRLTKPKLAEGNFQRGGFRATAGPRLGWSKPQKEFPRKIANNTQFAQWSVRDICDWLNELGLAAYVENCKAWVKNGATLLQATNQDIEKELGIHNPLHKKKLMLSLQALDEEEEVDGLIIKGAGMDMLWVSRWLDDIGLPQYKDTFYESCIDGRMLHHLTIADLQRLRVTNLLHTLSLRRAIYTLRKINFDPTELKRRPVNEKEKENVSLWTNHRVMEWLRSIDLAEYAPNLRGSGVHGSLMVLEPQFNGETLASLLHIPNSKSLLRRHLSAKFIDLIPEEYKGHKLSENVSSLHITAKVKIGRRSFGPLTRLRGSNSGYSSREFSSGEYVCPIETKNSGINRSFGSHRRNLEARLQMQDTNEKAWDISDDKGIDDNGSGSDIKVVELNENTTRKIGAFSAELATMTNKWSEE